MGQLQGISRGGQGVGGRWGRRQRQGHGGCMWRDGVWGLMTSNYELMISSPECKYA